MASFSSQWSAERVAQTQPLNNKAKHHLTLRPQDVIFGKGSGILNHAGNRKLLELIRLRIGAGEETAASVAQAVVEEIATANGRFVDLVHSYEDGKCVEVSEERAIAKVMYTFQNERKKPKNKKRSSPSSESAASGMIYKKRQIKATTKTYGANNDASSKYKIKAATSSMRSTRIANQPNQNKYAAASTGRPTLTVLDETDVVMGTDDRKVSKLPGNIEFMNFVRILSKVFPQSRHKTNVKERVAGKILTAVQALDPPGRFVVLAQGTSMKRPTYMILKDKDAKEMICEVIDNVYLQQFGEEYVERVPHPFVRLPPSSPPANRFARTGSRRILSPMIDDQEVAEIMLGLRSDSGSVGMTENPGRRPRSFEDTSMYSGFAVASHRPALKPVDGNSPSQYHQDVSNKPEQVYGRRRSDLFMADSENLAYF
jgi:hypothetical protein